MRDLREPLRTKLTSALKNRDRVAAGALRSVIAELDNAEAIEVVETETETGSVSTEYMAGGVVGLGAAEANRHELSAAEQQALVEREIAARLAAAGEYDELGQSEPAARLRHEADVIRDALEAT